MSSILLSNPFVTAPPPSQAATEAPVLPTALAAVAPAQRGADARGAGDAMAQDGPGSGRGRSIGTASQQAVLADRRVPLNGNRPPNATANSVIDAQARGAQPSPDSLDPRPGVTDPVQEVQMPDPLPTSPFLKMMSARG